MSLFQIHYEHPKSGAIYFRYVGAANLESAIKRFKEVFQEKIITVNELSSYLLV